MSTCPPLPLGSVTGETGTVNGSPAVFADATSVKDGVAGQWQWYALLSTHAGVGDRYRLTRQGRGERLLLVTMIGWRLDGDLFAPCPPPPTPITFELDTISGGTEHAQYIDGMGYELNGNLTWYGTTSKCHQSQEAPTGGTATYTRFDDATIEGSYSIEFGSDVAAGSFVAPRCDFTGCPPRPTRGTCVTV